MSLLLIFYAAFVQDYLSNLYLQTWIRATFPWARYLLNYYAVLTVAAMLGFLMIWLAEKQRLERLRK